MNTVSSTLEHRDIDTGRLVFAKIKWNVSDEFESIHFLDSTGKKWYINDIKELLERNTIWPQSQEIRVIGFNNSLELCIRGIHSDKITYYDALNQLYIFIKQEHVRSNCFFEGIYYDFVEDVDGRPIFKAVFHS